LQVGFGILLRGLQNTRNDNIKQQKANMQNKPSFFIAGWICQFAE
jgi:hypothetical protein